MKRIYIIFLLMAIFSNTALAQWTKNKGNGYYKLSTYWIESDQHYTDTGKIDPNITRGQFNVNFYAEYGITDKWDAIGYIPFFARTYQNDVYSKTSGNLITKGEAVNSIGDIDIGIKYGFIKTDKMALSATLSLGLPTGNDAGGNDESYQTGDGEFNQLLQVDFGVPFKIRNNPSYAKTFLGYNNRTKNFSDELRVGGEFGINLFKKLWLATKLNIVKSLRNGSLNATNNPGSIFANNVEYSGISFEAAYYITDKFGVSFNLGRAFSGRIIYASPSYSGGIFLDIK